MNLRRKPTSPEEFIAAAASSNGVDTDEKIQQLEQQLAAQQEREQALVSEISQLRSRSLDDSEQAQLKQQLDELRNRLEQSQGSIDYPTSKMKANKSQPRKTFDSEVAAMKKSLLTEGQLDPVMIFEDGTLFDGECRWRAGSELGWETLETVIVPRPDDKTVLRRAYLTSLHRQGLNPLDRAEALVRIICSEVTTVSEEEVPRIVRRVLKRLQRKKIKLDSDLYLQSQETQQAAILALEANIEISEAEASVFLVLLGLQENPTSVETNIFPYLNLASDLKEAIRGRRSLLCPLALELNQLNAEKLDKTEDEAREIRQTVTETVLDQGLTIQQTKQLVAQYLSPRKAQSPDAKVERWIRSTQEIDWAQAVTLLEPERRQDLVRSLELALDQLKKAEG